MAGLCEERMLLQEQLRSTWGQPLEATPAAGKAHPLEATQTDAPSPPSGQAGTRNRPGFLLPHPQQSLFRLRGGRPKGEMMSRLGRDGLRGASHLAPGGHTNQPQDKWQPSASNTWATGEAFSIHLSGPQVFSSLKWEK